MDWSLQTIATWSGAAALAASSMFRAMAQAMDALVMQFTNNSDLSVAWSGGSSGSALKASQAVGVSIQDLTRSYTDAADALAAAAGQIEMAQQQAAEAVKLVAGLSQSVEIDVTTGELSWPAGDAGASLIQSDPAAYMYAMSTSTKAQEALRVASLVDNNTAQALMDAIGYSVATPGWIGAEIARIENTESKNLTFAVMTASITIGNPQASAFEYSILYKTIEQLSADELISFYEQLTPTQAANWQAWINSNTGYYQTGTTGALPPPSAAYLAMLSYVTKSLPADEMAELNHKFGFFEPSLQLSDNDGSNQWSDLVRFQPGSQATMDISGSTDVNQGEVGDCVLLAALAAVSETQPQVLRQNMVFNANGSVTINLWRDGVEYPITISTYLPRAIGGGAYPYAHTQIEADGTEVPNAVLWPELYEKAFAQLYGGYEPLNGLDGPTTLGAITGVKVDGSTVVGAPTTTVGNVELATTDVSLSQIQQALDMHQALIVSNIDDGQNLYPSGHEYAVVSVNIEAGTVTIQNPWGLTQPSATDPSPHFSDQFQTMSLANFQKYFSTISASLPVAGPTK